MANEYRGGCGHRVNTIADGLCDPVCAVAVVAVVVVVVVVDEGPYRLSRVLQRVIIQTRLLHGMGGVGEGGRGEREGGREGSGGVGGGGIRVGLYVTVRTTDAAE